MGRDEPVRNYLSQFRDSEIIYPAKVAKDLGTNMLNAYRYIDPAVGTLVEPVLEPLCRQCGNLSGEQYATLTEVPEEIVCQKCGEQTPIGFKDLIVVYRKIREQPLTPPHEEQNISTDPYAKILRHLEKAEEGLCKVVESLKESDDPVSIDEYAFANPLLDMLQSGIRDLKAHQNTNNI